MGSKSNKIELQINWEYLGGRNQDQPQMIPLDGAEINIFNTKLEKIYSGAIENGKIGFPVSDEDMEYSVVIKAIHETDFSVMNNGFVYAVQIESGQFAYSDMNKEGNLIFVHNIVNEKIYNATTGVWSVFHAIKDLMAIARSELSFESKIKNREIYINDSDGPFYLGEAQNDKVAGSISLKSSDLFSWDIIAHEFAHAILYETNALDMTLAVAGAHNGTNQYDYINFDKVSKEKQQEDESLQKLPALQRELDDLNAALNDPTKDQNETHKEIDRVNQEIEEAKRNADPKFIRENNANLGYHNKERAMSIAFSEGCATWLGLSLLTHSSYRYDAINEAKRIETVGTSKYTRYGEKDRDLGLAIDPLHPNYFGKDAEFAIARLLWSITNKNKLYPKLGRLESLGVQNPSNSNYTPWKELFNRVFIDKDGKGLGLKNIDDFHHWFLLDIKDYLALSHADMLFAEFGMTLYTPDSSNPYQLFPSDKPFKMGDSLAWYQGKTGTMLEDDITFDIYLYIFDDGRESTRHMARVESSALKPDDGKNGKLTYEYILTDKDKLFISKVYAHIPRGYLFTATFETAFLIRTTIENIVKDGKTTKETRSYFGNLNWNLGLDWDWLYSLPYTHICDGTC